MIYELLTGEILFKSQNWIEFFSHVTDETNQILTAEQKEKVQNNTLVLKLLNFMMVRKPSKRPDINRVLKYFEAIVISYDFEFWNSLQEPSIQVDNSICIDFDLSKGLVFFEIEESKMVSFIQTFRNKNEESKKLLKLSGSSEQEAIDMEEVDPYEDKLIDEMKRQTHSSFSKLMILFIKLLANKFISKKILDKSYLLFTNIFSSQNRNKPVKDTFFVLLFSWIPFVLIDSVKPGNLELSLTGKLNVNYKNFP